MTKKRFYILKNADAPEEDLWVELENVNLAVPYLRLCCEGENGKQNIVTLTPAMASRLINSLRELLDIVSNPIEDYVVESDQAGE